MQVRWKIFFLVWFGYCFWKHTISVPEYAEDRDLTAGFK